MALYPLIITFADVVSVGSVMARVHGDTKVLGEFDGETWTLSAVAAGGIVAKGKTPKEAHLAFRRELRMAIEDSIVEGWPFSAFAEEVRCVFSSVDPMVERLWQESLEALRSGELKAADGAEALKRKKESDSRGVTVSELPNQSASDENLWFAMPKAA